MYDATKIVKRNEPKKKHINYLSFVKKFADLMEFSEIIVILCRKTLQNENKNDIIIVVELPVDGAEQRTDW